MKQFWKDCDLNSDMEATEVTDCSDRSDCDFEDLDNGTVDYLMPNETAKSLRKYPNDTCNFPQFCKADTESTDASEKDDHSKNKRGLSCAELSQQSKRFLGPMEIYFGWDMVQKGFWVLDSQLLNC